MTRRAFQLKVTLHGVVPKTWRRIIVHDDMTFYKLQKTIQTAFGWPISRSSEFKVRGIIVCLRQSEVDILREFLNSATTRMDVFHLLEGETIDMIQDNVDDWRFDIEIERELSLDQYERYPICIDFKGVTPPKNIGSPQKFKLYRKAISENEHVVTDYYEPVHIERINETLLGV